VRWQVIPNLGRTLSAVTALPVTASSQTPASGGPRLEDQLLLFDSGAVTVKAYVSPTLNFSGAKDGVRYAVSFDDEAPQIVNITADTSTAGWERSVADNIRILGTHHQLARPGAHVLKL